MEHLSNPVLWLSQQIGVTQPALRLIFTLLAGYPLALVHRKFIYTKEPRIQHLYFILLGFLLGYWNYGTEIFHCAFATLFTYLTLAILKGTSLSVTIVFVFNLGYLLLGYFYSGTDSYDINWTMPQCILTLRLIGIAFDLFDGHQAIETLSASSKKLALLQTPSLLEIFGHCFFPSAFLVGPQFSMKRYLEFVNGQYNSKNGSPPASTSAALRRLCLGLLYLTIFQVLGMAVSDEYMLTKKFGNLPFLRRMILLGMWGRFTLYKYISVWLLTEGACILFGVAYNGEDEKGNTKWDGLQNIKLSIFENTTEFNHYIKSFNVNTNEWIAQYVYKRLKFFGNRHISQFVSLLFLAIWHGFHSGYYVCFFFEFIVIYMERDLKSIIKSNQPLADFFASPILQLPLQIVLRIYTVVFMGWCLLPFALLQYPKYFKAMANVSYVGVLLFILWPILHAPLLRFILRKCIKKRNE